MLKFIRKYRSFFNILAFSLFAIVSFSKFYEYLNDTVESTKQKNMKLFVAIAFGILALIKVVQLFEDLKKKKTE